MIDNPVAAPAASAPKGAAHLTTDNFQKTILEAGKPVFVDFYADWCGPCKLAAPIVDKLADELREQVMITKLNTDEAVDVAREYGVMSIPTVIIFSEKDGKVVELERKVGFGGEEGYRQLLAKHLK
jgi:thioredoxin 1